MKSNKPVYLDDNERRPFGRNYTLCLIALCITTVAVCVFGSSMLEAKKAQANPAKACEALFIAFDEAQLSPGWYESAGQVLQQCGKDVTDDDIKFKVCVANRVHGYETADCKR